MFLRFILCFTAVKNLKFYFCRFSDDNFQNFQQFINLKLGWLIFNKCNIPEMGSFCSFLKSINIREIRLTGNHFSSKNISNIFKIFMKILKIKILFQLLKTT
eukprot:snap_masked-scaffold_24-processed-gene-5.21-mRNA-1 protein AED:1.00 eAED:1.00 QI:0/0/0/0/1/1/5/0/101